MPKCKVTEIQYALGHVCFVIAGSSDQSQRPESATRVSDQRLRLDVADSCSFEGHAFDRSGCR